MHLMPTPFVFMHFVCLFATSFCVSVSAFAIVCVCVRARTVEQRLCVSSGVPSVSLSLITV